jgi:hypothetical protein
MYGMGRKGVMFQSLVIMVVTIAVAVGCGAIVFRVLGDRQKQQREADLKRSRLLVFRLAALIERAALHLLPSAVCNPM